ncbi:Protein MICRORCHIDIA 2 [Bienertia sinuspersici]
MVRRSGNECDRSNGHSIPDVDIANKVAVVYLEAYNDLEHNHRLEGIPRNNIFVSKLKESVRGCGDGNGFKTSTMRLGADVIVLSRSTRSG